MKTTNVWGVCVSKFFFTKYIFQIKGNLLPTGPGLVHRITTLVGDTNLDIKPWRLGALPKLQMKIKVHILKAGLDKPS